MRAPHRLAAVLIFAFGVATAQEPNTFHSGTRLVEVDVVIRDKHGPVMGLTKDDFTLYDCTASDRSPYQNQRTNPCKGKHQQIDEFREISEASGAQAAAALPLPPGAVSNRAYVDGKPLDSATAVVIDQLNTPLDFKGYQRARVAEFLQSAGVGNRIALYSLGEDLHLIQDLTDDPKKLMDAVAKLDSGDQLRPAASADRLGGIENQVMASVREDTTVEAIREIVRQMKGVPGRKNLIWISQNFSFFDPRFGLPEARILLGQANIALYPVMVRSIARAPAFVGRGGMPPYLGIEYVTRQLGQSLGGSAFDDAGDITTALQTAEQDSKNYYALGFYPAESDLDGTAHQLTLELSKKVAGRSGLILDYRQVYYATRSGSANLQDRLTITDLFNNPVDTREIALTGQVKNDPLKPGERQIVITLNLADIRVERQGDRWVASFQTGFRLEKMEAGLSAATQPQVYTVSLKLTEEELRAKLASGIQIERDLPPDAKPGSVRVVVVDVATGATGSLRVPIGASR